MAQKSAVAHNVEDHTLPLVRESAAAHSVEDHSLPLS